MIRYTDEIPQPTNLYELYNSVNWNDFLQLPPDRLHKAMLQSWLVISAYDHNKLIGTGRVISDGVINAYICGLVVHPDYRNQGIGREIFQRLVDRCDKENLHSQLFCGDTLIPYYQKLGFEIFATGMKNRENG
ncbi:GNAT family N-acetyltransferase [Neobacillus sp. LXY-4]|uniref:GNAT family N-acetyltransferase n=1 Tax=Neobacillus sp. LXY-4 TaxID=3379826 RepID=UPI003EE1FDA2